MRIIWTEPARDRLVEIEEYIAQDAPERAVSFILELMEQANKLTEFPNAGRAVPEDEERIRRELIYEGYRIIYRVEGETVYILSVFEGSRLIRLNDMSDK